MRENSGTMVTWLWLVGPISICLGAIAAAQVLRCREASDRAQRCAGILAILAGVVAAYQVLRYGWPVVLWGVVGAVVTRYTNVLRTRCAGFVREIVTTVRNVVIAATVGVAIVVAMQVVLAHLVDQHAEWVLHWSAQIAVVYRWLEQVVFLGPLRLAFLLVASVVIVAVVMPALQLVRSYRRVANLATYALLAVTVTSSFTFFTGRNAPGWQREWIAKLGNELGSEVEEIDRRNTEVVQLAAIGVALRGSLPDSRMQLRILASTIDRHPDREEIWKRIGEEWKHGGGLAPIEERTRQARARLAETRPATPEERATAEALDRLRRVRTAPAEVRLTDLDVLRVQRTASQAAHEEAILAIVEMAAEVVIGKILAGQVLKTMLVGMKGERARHGRVVDMKAARAAMNSSKDVPPGISLDLIGIPSTTVTEDIARQNIEIKISNIGKEVAAERLRQARARVEAGGGVVVVPGVGTPRPVDTGSRGRGGGGGGGRSGGGGRFGTRRKDRSRPPVRLYD